MIVRNGRDIQTYFGAEALSNIRVILSSCTAMYGFWAQIWENTQSPKGDDMRFVVTVIVLRRKETKLAGKLFVLIESKKSRLVTHTHIEFRWAARADSVLNIIKERGLMNHIRW